MEDSEEVRDAVKRYIDALKVARTDSEKLAALLVVAQIEKNMKLSATERKAVYGSLELAFIKKLLNWKREPDSAEKGTLMSLGITILSCMINEIEQVSARHDILEFIPRLIDIIYEINNGSDDSWIEELEKDVLDNCFSILMIIASNENGCRSIMHSWSFKSEIILKADSSIKLLKIIVNCMAILTEDVLVGFKEPIKALIYQAASLFSLSSNEDKFTLLALIFQFFITGTEKQIFNNFSERFVNELKLLRRGLLDVIQSKIDKKQKHVALNLISTLINLFGLKWTYVSFPDEDVKYSKKFLHLLVSLTSVEIKMFFYDKSDDITLLSYFFTIIERLIESIGVDEDNCIVNENNIIVNENNSIDAQLGENVTTKILQTITGTVKEVVIFLDEMKETLQPTDACQDLKILACISLLCAYMSEETQALEKEVVKIAPYMIVLAKTSFDIHRKELLEFVNFKDSRPAVIFTFLLPVLCHWSADDKLRFMLLEADLHSTLWEFLHMLLTCHENAALETIETLAGIFMNIAITEPKLASDPKTVFGPMLKLIMQKISDYIEWPVQLLMNIVTLGLILARAQLHLKTENTNSIDRFFGQCLHCFYDVCPFLHIEDEHKLSKWPQISELWFVGIDNFMACVAESKHLKDIFNGDTVIPQMMQFVEKYQANESEDIRPIYIVLKNLVMVLGQ